MLTKWKLPPGYSTRLAEKSDEAFLLSLFCSARPELSSLPLPAEQLMLLLKHQYSLQQSGYATQYPHAEHWIIATHSGTVGKIMLERSQKGVHVIDFVIAPDWRRRGVGAIILNTLKTDIDKQHNVLSLRVDHQNVLARNFYYRLGFVMQESSATHELLVWRPI